MHTFLILCHLTSLQYFHFEFLIDRFIGIVFGKICEKFYKYNFKELVDKRTSTYSNFPIPIPLQPDIVEF